MSCKVKKIIKPILFTIIIFMILAVCGFILQPIFDDDNMNYNTTHGFYEEPSNTIETVLLGSSQMQNGINPMQLYEDYGICAYNYSTDGQSVRDSYYCLEEVYRFQSDSLDTVVLDTSSFRREPAMAEYHRAIDPMRFSLPKIHAVKAYSENFEEFLYNIFPVLSYHERWKELSSSDFLKYEQKSQLYLRGYYYILDQTVCNVNSASDLKIPLLVLDEGEQNFKIDETEVLYFKKMVSFCEDNNLKLVLIKTPTDWTSSNHNAIQVLANTYGVDFIDFNVDPYYSEINYNFVVDSLDARASNTNIHANYYGAAKMSDYLGRYLIEECGNHDIRGDERYTFMEEELDDYHKYNTFMQTLSRATDPCEYIETVINNGDYTVFISVKDDAAASLTKEQRTYFKSIGLINLSQLTDRTAYLAVIDNGNVLTEQYQPDPGDDNATDTPISYTGTLHNGTSYTIISGGYNTGNKSSIIIGDTERSNNRRGLNIVIYDNNQQQYVTNANFDTYDAPERTDTFTEQSYENLISTGVSISSLTGVERIMYLYNRECENYKKAMIARLEKDEEDGLTTYLKTFWDDENIDILITAQGDASEVLTDNLRAELSELGLSELSQLSYSDSYVAAICNGDITEEGLHYSKVPLEVSSDKYSIKSIGREGYDDTSSVIINGTEYVPEQDGIFIVIYDNITEMAVDTITFEPKTDDAYDAEEIVG